MKSGLMLTIFKEKDSSYCSAGEPRQTTFWSSKIISDILRTFYVRIVIGRGEWKTVLALWKFVIAWDRCGICTEDTRNAHSDMQAIANRVLSMGQALF